MNHCLNLTLLQFITLVCHRSTNQENAGHHQCKYQNEANFDRDSQ